MALRLEAGNLERNAARYAALQLIESHDSNDAPAVSNAEDCPSADDLLDFCQAKLPARRSIFVQRHLDLCATCMALTTLALNEWAPHEPIEWLDVASNFHPGDRIDGRYQIIRFLACGGMGEVYEAIDTHTSERLALKAVLAASSDSRHMLRSFRHEARLARKVRHPNVCHVHDGSYTQVLGQVRHPVRNPIRAIRRAGTPPHQGVAAKNVGGRLRRGRAGSVKRERHRVLVIGIGPHALLTPPN